MMALPDSSRNRGPDLGLISPANVVPDGAQPLHAERDDDARIRALVLESADGLMLASELVADETARASLRRYADELAAWSEAWLPPVVENTARIEQPSLDLDRNV